MCSLSKNNKNLWIWHISNWSARFIRQCIMYYFRPEGIKTFLFVWFYSISNIFMGGIYCFCIFCMHKSVFSGDAFIVRNIFIENFYCEMYTRCIPRKVCLQCFSLHHHPRQSIEIFLSCKWSLTRNRTTSLTTKHVFVFERCWDCSHKMVFQQRAVLTK